MFIGALEDDDPGVRWQAARALSEIGAAAVPALIGALGGDDYDVRWDAAEILGEIGAAAVPALIGALDDDDSGVRGHAAQALGKIGAAAEPAIPALIGALEGDDFEMRWEAAQALGKIGAAAEPAVPALVHALKDDDYDGEWKSDVPYEAAVALGAIAEALLGQFLANDVDRAEILFMSEFEEAYSVLRRGENEFDIAEQMGRAVAGLRFINQRHENRLANRVQNVILAQPTVSGLIGLYLSLLLLWLSFLWLRPLWLLKVNDKLKPYGDWQLPSWLGGMTLPLRYVLLAAFFHYHPRVLDAWLAAHLDTARRNFASVPTVKARKIHIDLPVEREGEYSPHLTASDLHVVFARKVSCLLVQGEGGIGKTSLACQIAWWAMSEDASERPNASHRMLPVLIESDFDSFEDTVNARVRQLVQSEEEFPAELLMQLLRTRRLLVIVDHLSELSEETRSAFQPGDSRFPANALIVTSRVKEDLGGRQHTTVEPIRIRGDLKSEFMSAYLRSIGERDLFSDEDFFSMVSRLSALQDGRTDRDITVLLARLYADQMVAVKKGALEGLPANIPDLMLTYVSQINESRQEGDADNPTVHRAAKVIAWHCLKDSYHPSPAKVEDVQAALQQVEDADVMGYLEKRLGLLQKVRPAEDRIQFTLDPLAEYLAALYVVERAGNDDQTWRKFIDESKDMPGAPATVRDFLLAVRDCCLHRVYGSGTPEWVLDELAKHAGLDVDLLERIRSEQRVKRLLLDLSRPDPEDRVLALDGLIRMGPSAAAAVPVIIGALDDQSHAVRRGAAWALGEIGAAAEPAIPALIVTLTDDDPEVRSRAAYALGQIGPAAGAALPALVSRLENTE